MSSSACLGFLALFALTARVAAAQDDAEWWDGLSAHGTNGAVNAFAVYNGMLIAAGDFTVAGQTAAKHVAAWDGNAWHNLGSGIEFSPQYAARWKHA